MKEQINRWET